MNWKKILLKVCNDLCYFNYAAYLLALLFEQLSYLLIVDFE